MSDRQVREGGLVHNTGRFFPPMHPHVRHAHKVPSLHFHQRTSYYEPFIHVLTGPDSGRDSSGSQHMLTDHRLSDDFNRSVSLNEYQRPISSRGSSSSYSAVEYDLLSIPLVFLYAFSLSPPTLPSLQDTLPLSPFLLSITLPTLLFLLPLFSSTSICVAFCLLKRVTREFVQTVPCHIFCQG